MSLADRIAATFRMDDESWRRHANPWSVWTRFAAIPAAALAIWSREWIGWWALVPFGLVVVWLVLNTRVFRPVSGASSWAAKGIFGEHRWLEDHSRVPSGHRVVLRWLVATGLAGAVLMFYGLAVLAVWPTVMGMSLLVLAQLWRIDRFGLLYEERQRSG